MVAQKKNKCNNLFEMCFPAKKHEEGENTYMVCDRLSLDLTSLNCIIILPMSKKNVSKVCHTVRRVNSNKVLPNQFWVNI